MPTPRRMPRRALPLLVALAALGAGAACARVQGAPPPTNSPDFVREATVVGARIMIAARAARSLQDFAYNTKRFRSDSMWASRAMDDMKMRVRFSSAARDSTRVRVELWGKCERERAACLPGEFALLINALRQEDAPPP